jgi:multiple sugar transport system ATP-binding protein
MNNGRVAQIGAPLEVYWQPADTFVARFLGSPPMNLFTQPLMSDDSAYRIDGPTIQAPLVRWAPATLAPLAGRPVVLGVRAEDLHLDPARCGDPAQGRLRGRAFAVEPLGAETLLAIETEGGIDCTARLPRDIRVTPGEMVDLCFAARAAYLFDAETGRAVPGAAP